MSIRLNASEIDDAVPSIQRYMHEEHEVELSGLEAQLLLKFFVQEVGPMVYNRGIADAESYFREKVEDSPSVCFEEPLTFWVKATKKKKK